MNETSRSIFSGMQVYSAKKWLTNQAVIVENNRIKAIIPQEMTAHHLPAKQFHFPSDHYLIPGLIDLHVHGARDRDVMDGSVESLKIMSRALAEEGVTGFLATTMTMETTVIEQALASVASAIKEDDQRGAKILGIHLEGPFIAKDKMGAQQGLYTQLPSSVLLSHWQSIADQQIRIVTLAPELPGAIPFIQYLRDRNIIAAIGHTNATYDETREAIRVGASYATHLFNAMSGLHQREVGAAGALLLLNVNAEIIADGYHLHPAMCELALRMKGKEHMVLVSDAMRAKCMGDGTFDLGGQVVTVANGKATLSDGTLAGSTLTLTQAIRNMVTFTRCALLDAIQMASHYPAAILGLGAQKGSVEVGFDADLAVLDASFSAVLTMREGSVVFAK